MQILSQLKTLILMDYSKRRSVGWGKKDVPRDANVIGARFLLALKNHGTPSEVAKARYVAQGYNDKERRFLVHDVLLLRPASVHRFITVAACKGWRLFDHVVIQVYCQVAKELIRKLFLQPKLEDLELFGVHPDELMELLLLLYGLCDAGGC